jgi:probable F420-dependent oxidoreductase
VRAVCPPNGWWASCATVYAPGAKFGIHLTVGPKGWTDITVAAEAAGFESVWLPDHVVFPVEMHAEPGTPASAMIPPLGANTPIWDPFVQIAWLAAHTSTIRFGTNVFNLGLRHPLVAARALTTADLVSGGRVAFGVGASWLPEEWTAMELDFTTRGRRVDESLRIIRRLLTDEVIEHDGEFFHIQPIGYLPKPVTGSIPFHIGGDSAGALRRAAEFGDGWIPPPQPDMETFHRRRAEIERQRTTAGRTGPFEVTLIIPDLASVDEVRRYEDAGVDRLLVRPFSHPRDGVDAMHRFGDEIIAKL